MNASTPTSPATPKSASPRAKDHDLLAQRLKQILIQLNQGQALEPAALAQEFAVALRTIQRDLNERLGFLPMDKTGGTYRLQASAQGKLTLQDLRRFASLAGGQGLFPDLGLDFLRELFDQRVESAWLVKGSQYEDHSDPKQILPIVRYWIPQVRVISPEGL